LIVVAEGQLHWDEATRRFDPDRSDSVVVPVLALHTTAPSRVLT